MSDDDKPRKGKSVELRGHVRLSFTATHRVLPNLPLELSTAPHPEGLRIVAQFAEQTDEETRAAEEAGRFAMRPLVGFVLYPPAPLTEDEAAARLAAITADLWAAADAAHRAGLADERTDPVVRHVVEHSYTFTDDGKRLPIPPDLVRARLAAVDAGDAAHRRLQELLGMGEADAGDAVAGEPVPPGAPATDAEMFALSLVAGMVAPLFMPPDYPALTYMDPLPKKRGRPRRGPEVVPQQTSPEFEAVIFGVVVDGRTATKDTGDAAPWQDVAGEVALTHKRKGSPLSLHFGASAVDDPTRDFVPLRATSPAELRELLEQVAGPRTAHLYNYTLVRAREELDGYTESAIDFIERQHKAGKPFFCWWNSTKMHIWTHLKDGVKGKTGLGVYPDGMVEHDRQVGQLLGGIIEGLAADPRGGAERFFAGVVRKERHGQQHALAGVVQQLPAALEQIIE